MRLLSKVFAALIVFTGAACFSETPTAVTGRRPLIHLTWRPMKSEFKAREPWLVEVTLKNQSKENLTVPEFEDVKTGVSYLYDLSLEKIASDGSVQKLKTLRPNVPVKAAHALVKVLLSPGAEKKYLFDLKWWAVIHDRPPIYREIEAGTYRFKINWVPPSKSWFGSNGVEYIPSVSQGSSEKLVIK